MFLRIMFSTRNTLTHILNKADTKHKWGMNACSHIMQQVLGMRVLFDRLVRLLFISAGTGGPPKAGSQMFCLQVLLDQGFDFQL